MRTFSTFDIAGSALSALSAQSLRLNLTASNLANMHNVAGDAASVYRARHAVFQAASDPFGSVLAGVNVLGVIESETPPIERYDLGNPQANEEGVVYASSVNAMEEMANMISASRSYQTNVEMMNTAKTLLLKTLAIGQ